MSFPRKRESHFAYFAGGLVGNSVTVSGMPDRMVTATRRLRARPSGVALSATEIFDAWPTAVNRSGATPASMNKRTTLDARTAGKKRAARAGPASPAVTKKQRVPAVPAFPADHTTHAGAATAPVTDETAVTPAATVDSVSAVAAGPAFTSACRASFVHFAARRSHSSS